VKIAFEIPEALFRQTKATAALRRESLGGFGGSDDSS
jgi:hypothetical protein